MFHVKHLKNKQELGRFGEKIAARYLKRKGYKIMEANFRYKNFGEIDLIVRKSNKKWLFFKKLGDLVFVEVKTRLKVENSVFGPEHNITKFKQKQLLKLAKIYLAKHKLFEIPWQIDIISIEIDPLNHKKFDLQHIEKAVFG